MKCAVVCCNSKYDPLNRKTGISFHKFPTEPDALHVWIAATGNPRFTVEPSSKMCSKHFDNIDYKNAKSLKENAVPTKHLREIIEIKTDDDDDDDDGDDDVTIIDTNLSKNRTSDPLACGLKPYTMMNDIQVIQACTNENVSHPKFTPQSRCSMPATQSIVVTQGSSLINFIPSSSGLIYSSLSRTSDINLNFDHNTVLKDNPAHAMPMQINVPVNIIQVQGMSMMNKAMPMTLATKSRNSLSQPIQLQGNSQSPPQGIKIVDVNTLLQQPHKNVKVINSPKIIECEEPTNKGNTIKGIKNVINKQMQESNISCTVFHVLNCLKIVLTGKYDLAQLIPNEKLVELVVKYLKLGGTESSRTMVKRNLSIIIQAAKMVRKSYNDYLKPHPYLSINNYDLQLVLSEVLPTKFSMQDVSDDLLNCICVLLNQDIYTDCFHILRDKIHKITNDDQPCKEITKQPFVEASSSENRSFKKIKSRIQSHSKKNDKVTIHEIDISHSEVFDKEKEVTGKKPKYSKTSSGKGVVLKLSNSSDSKYDNVHDDSEDDGIQDDDDKDPNYTPPNRMKMAKLKSIKVEEEVTKPNGIIVKMVLNYLEERKCTAQDVLANFRLIFYLCRSLNLKSKQSNIDKIKSILWMIIRKNINQNNVNQLKEDFQIEKNVKSHRGPKSCKTPTKNRTDKLKLKPIVVLTDVADYRKERRASIKEEKKCHKSNGYYEQKIPLCFQHKSPVSKYSSEFVKKLTKEKYKEFRRIIARNNNNKVVFCLKYEYLVPGTNVFVKDFRNLSLGWVKGYVKERVSAFKYEVEVENGETWICFADQIRPLPDAEANRLNSNPRSHRIIKPKQLFDL